MNVAPIGFFFVSALSFLVPLVIGIYLLVLASRLVRALESISADTRSMVRLFAERPDLR